MKKKTKSKLLSLLMALVLVLCGSPLAQAPVYGAAPDESELTGGLITAFSELPEEVRWQNTESPLFPETVEAMVEGNTVEIPVTWEADHDYDAQYPQRGLYVFTAVLGEGYTVAGGVELPRLTVYIPRTAGLMMARMAGSGSSDSPLEITTAAQLSEIATLVNAGRLESFILNNAPNAKVNLKLMNNIDLSAYSSGEGWTSIGTWDNRFKGIFDGNGQVISGLYIKRNASFQGLFGYVSGGTIQNLGLINIDIKGTQNVGGIAGYIVDGTVQNCYTTGSVGNTTNGGFRYLGGVVGQVASGTVKNCYSTASVSGTASSYSVRAGGVVGQAQESTVVENSYSTGNVSGTVSGSSVSVGGVVGYSASGATVKNCYSTGSVSGTVSGSTIGTYVGGVVGYLSSSSSSTSTVQNCVALNSSISGTAGDFGRVVGIDYGTLSNNYAFSGMKVNGSTVMTDDPSSNDGKLLDRDYIVNADFPDGLFDSESWTVVPDKLPVLVGLDGQDGTIQFHIRGSFEGEGTSGSPYLIKTAADLANLAELVNAGNTAYNEKHYRLENNLDLSAYGVNYDSGKGWTPIGAYSADSSKAFKGNFDGNSHVISGLYINRSSEHQGLFGYIYGGTVINLGLTDVNISGTGSVGGVAGRVDNSSTIQNCYSTGSVRATANNVGGVAGFVYNSSKIQNCYSTGSVSGSGDNVGGVAGNVTNSSTIQNCYSHSGVTGRDYVGGVAGYVNNSIIQNSYSIGSVRGTRSYVGGVAGTVNSSSTIQNSYSTGSVSGSGNNVGGVAGSVNSSTLQNSYSTGSVIGTNYVGGVAGIVTGSVGTSGTVENSAALNSSVKTSNSSNSSVGRVAGLLGGTATLSENYAFSGMTLQTGSVDKTLSGGMSVIAQFMVHRKALQK